MAPRCDLLLWGRLGYDEAIRRMDSRVRMRRTGEVDDALILVEHDPVITLGRGSHAANLIATPGELERNGVSVREAGRGGDVTYHGPGQLVGYPVIALGAEKRDAHRYLRELEDVIILALSDFGIEACRREGLTGVWVENPAARAGQMKIASIGVRFSSWVTSHGFALNVHGDLPGFDAIVPCGIPGVEMTSMQRVLDSKNRGREIGLDDLTAPIVRRFGEVFDREMTVANAPAYATARIA